MDAHGRGDAGEIDPADQWVFNPDTGSYELRLTGTDRVPTGSAAGARTARGAARTGAPRRGTASPGRRAAPAGDRPPPGAGDRQVPAQRDRRAPRNRRKQKEVKRRSGRKRALMWVGGALAMLLIVGAAGVFWAYQRLNDNIDKVDVGIRNPATSDGPVNILFIGTDQRLGEGNSGYGDAGSEGHADTTILLHVSADRSHATALSIPRDLITDIPDCETIGSDGSTTVIPGDQRVRFNQSYGQKGRDPGCTWRTVEQLTGLEINHFMMADFNAVKDLSTAVGGVPVCVAKDIDDPKSHLKLSAGTHRVEGEEALAFVRTRYAVGHGSDLSRIGLQQQFLASMAREMKSGDTLTNPVKLWDLAEAVTNAMTVDTGIGSINKLSDLARDLSRVEVSDITFVTLPVIDNPDEEVRATVVLDEAKAAPLFRMLQEDISLTSPEAEDEDGKNGDDAPEMAPASEVRVDIYNGGSRIGAAQETLDWLQNTHGVHLSTNAGNAGTPQQTTTLEHGPDQAGQAARLADLMGLPKDGLRELPQETGDVPMTLVLGDDFRGAGTPVEVPAKKPKDLDSVMADDEDVCAS
ncbi:LCP family protein [Streptomyces sodiiphilus]|uniref:LCP family protein n=1 Tax=Streptomyces sodiiphilus TaxID=226217 RepID=A0ABN2PLN0_9ACTN